MKEDGNKNWHKIIEVLPFVLPLLLLIWIVLSSYVLPRLFIKPEYNFLYSTGSTYYINLNVENGKLQATCSSYYAARCQDYKNRLDLYVFDVKAEESNPISFEQAKNLKLKEGKSPDGYEVRQSNGSGFFKEITEEFFGSDSKFVIVIENRFKKRIELQGYPYRYKINVLGWIVQ